MKYFVSGGAGFVGSNLVARLLKNPSCERLCVFDNLSSGSIEMISEFLGDSRVTFVEGDLHNTKLLEKSIAGYDAVFHLAANADISKAETDPVLDFREGTVLTQNVLEAMRLNGILKIVFTSGSGVYGEVPGQVFSESYGPCLPVSPYGAAKLGSEALISAYCNMFKMSGFAFRFANVVGPNQTHGVGYDFLNRLAVDRQCLSILGDGNQCKSYIYVSDVLEAIDLALTKSDPRIPFNVFNVATDDYITVSEIATIACSTVGIAPTDIKLTYTGGDRGWNGDVPQILFDTNKIRNLGWANKLTAFEAVKLSLQEMWSQKIFKLQ